MDTYKGKKIDDMTRDELVPALKDVMRRYLGALDEQVMLFNHVTRRDAGPAERLWRWVKNGQHLFGRSP